MMEYRNLVLHVVGAAFLCLIALTSATKKEELERAAELAVERAAERVAEKAVEKALETGNSSTETETIRATHTSVRKYDFTQQLPPYEIFTPEQRKDYLRETKEREAGELAVAQIKHSLFKRQAEDGPSEGGFDEDFDDISPNVGGLPFDTSFPGFGREGSGPLPISGFGPFRFTRQYQYSPVNQEQRGALGPKEEAKASADPKKEENHQANAFKNFVIPPRVYHVETRPFIYYAPIASQYPVYVAYQQPHVKIINQETPEANLGRDRRAWTHS